jgi:hypothetical protein
MFCLTYNQIAISLLPALIWLYFFIQEIQLKVLWIFWLEEHFYPSPIWRGLLNLKKALFLAIFFYLALYLHNFIFCTGSGFDNDPKITFSFQYGGPSTSPEGNLRKIKMFVNDMEVFRKEDPLSKSILSHLEPNLSSFPDAIMVRTPLSTYTYTTHGIHGKIYPHLHANDFFQVANMLGQNVEIIWEILPTPDPVVFDLKRVIIKVANYEVLEQIIQTEIANACKFCDSDFDFVLKARSVHKDAFDSIMYEKGIYEAIKSVDLNCKLPKPSREHFIPFEEAWYAFPRSYRFSILPIIDAIAAQSK